MKLAVIIPAAGSSSRYSASGGLRSKLDEDLGGRPVLQRAVELFTKREEVSLIVVAGPGEPAAYDEFIIRHGDKLGLLGVRCCRGGLTHRYETVKAAVDFLDKLAADKTPGATGLTHIAVHDAARPCATEELIDRVLRAAEKHAAVIPALDVPDTLKRVSAAALKQKEVDPFAAILGGAGLDTRNVRTVEATVPRDNLVMVQTPQVFEWGLLQRAYAQPDLASTDDAGLVERLGEKVYVVEGDPRNIKITRPVDLHVARLLLKVGPPAERAAHKKF